jgi:hypothetical protein
MIMNITKHFNLILLAIFPTISLTAQTIDVAGTDSESNDIVQLPSSTDYDISGTVITCHKTADITPVPTVQYNGVALIENTDYTLSYNYADATTHLGNLTITVTGMGGYSGIATLSLTLVGADIHDNTSNSYGVDIWARITGLNPNCCELMSNDDPDNLIACVASSTTGDLDIPAYLLHETESFAVSSIHARAFEGCNSLKSISFPSTIAKIPSDNAFKDITSLHFVNLSEATALVSYFESNGLSLDRNGHNGNNPFGGVSSNTIIYLPQGYTAQGTNYVNTDASGNRSCQLLSIEDACEYYFPFSFHTNKVENNRDISTALKANTICLPYDLPLLNKSLIAYTLSSTTTEELKFGPVQGELLRANTPYVIIPTKSAENLNVDSYEQVIPVTPVLANNNTIDGYSFCGSLQSISNEDSQGWFILQSDNKWASISNTTLQEQQAYIPSMRAYIVPPTGSPSRDFFVGNFVNNVRQQITEISTKAQGIYNLQGISTDMSYDKLKAGIYIFNGKKILKK